MTRSRVLCFLLSLFSVCPFLCSCSADVWSPPYAVTGSAVRVGAYASFYDFAGAHIVVANKSEKTIMRTTVSFLVFDSDGTLCSPVGASVVSEYDEKIKPLQSKEIIVSLDDALGPHVSGPYQIGNLFVSRIVYSDGTVWSDPFGFYAQ